MSDTETEKFPLVFEDPPQERSSAKTTVRMVVGFIVLVTVFRLVPFVTWHSEQQPDGSPVSVMNVWSQSLSYVHGAPPNWQRHKLSDGTVFEGAIENGRRNARWVMKTDGGFVKSVEYWHGEAIPEELQEERQ